MSTCDSKRRLRIKIRRCSGSTEKSIGDFAKLELFGQEIDPEKRDKLLAKNRVLLALSVDLERVIFVFESGEQWMLNRFEKDSLCIEYVTFLLDMCQVLCVCPPEN